VKARWQSVVLALVMVLATAAAASGAVDLEWRPAYQIVHSGDTVRIGLYAVSDSGSDWPISAMDVLVLHAPSYLAFSRVTSDGAPYDWLTDGFFANAPDNINKSLTDGNMMYSAWAQFGLPALATRKGLLVTTFEFVAQAPICSTLITIPPSYGTTARTRVFDGRVPNLDVTGRLGSASVMVVPPGVLTSVVQAKALPDDRTVDLAGPVVTRTFESCFYIEDRDRTAGIRVDCEPDQLPLQGTAPTVSGVISTVGGERVISQAVVTPGCAAGIPGPLGLNTRAAIAGLSPVGLLVKVAGTVTDVSAAGDTFMLSDGGEAGLRVELHGPSAPAEDAFAAVTGALGADAEGPVLRVNSATDPQVAPR